MWSLRMSLRWGALWAMLASPAAARAHGGQPIVQEILFPGRALGSGTPGEAWALTNNQGLYAGLPGEFEWLCEDAVVQNAGLQGLLVLDADRREWLVATNYGLYRSRDGGCSFAVLDGPLGTAVPLGLWQHPTRPLEIVVATQNPGPTPDDLWRSTDGGETFTPAGLGIIERARWFTRSEAAPDVLYLAHSEGLARSDDGGATFVPLPLGPEALGAAPEEMTLLGTHPTRPDEVWAAIERFPDSTVIRSRDRGQTWAPVLEVPDAPTGFVMTLDGEEALIATYFEGWRRSVDGGETWSAEDERVPLIGCLTRAPGDTTIWACSNVFIRGPWVLGRSDDAGKTWAPALRRYQDIAGLWACPPESPAARQCAGLCPGQSIGAACGEADAALPDADASAATDAGLADATTEDTDADPIAGDAGHVAPRGRSSQSGCSAHPVGSSGHLSMWSAAAACALGVVRRRRRRG